MTAVANLGSKKYGHKKKKKKTYSEIVTEMGEGSKSESWQKLLEACQDS